MNIHDIRNKLQVIEGYSELIQLSSDLEVIKRSAKKIFDLVIAMKELLEKE